MSNTVITNYTDLNGPSTKTDSSVVVIVNKDGSLSVDQKLLDTLMGTDGSQAAGISVVRVGHEGRPDDATDSEDENDKVPHVTLSVDSYYDEPDSIIKYDSGAEMLQSLRIETRENSLIGFQNDHCYTPLTSPRQNLQQKNETFTPYDDSVIEITHEPPPKPDSVTPKKISPEQKVMPKGKKVLINPMESSIVIKEKDLAKKVIPVFNKPKQNSTIEKKSEQEDQSESSSASSSGESAADRDSDSDYKESTNKLSPHKLRKTKTKPRILKSITKTARADPKAALRLKASKNIQKEIKRKASLKNVLTQKNPQTTPIQPKTVLPPTVVKKGKEVVNVTPKIIPKPIKREKKTPAHVTALLSDMSELFSTPDVIRRVSTENKVPNKSEKETVQSHKIDALPKSIEVANEKPSEENDKVAPIFKTQAQTKSYGKQVKTVNVPSQPKTYDTIPQLDDASLAQILQDSSPHSSKANAIISTANVINSPGLAGPLSPTLDLLAGLQPEEDGLTEDLLMHVAQLVESSENLQEVLDKQVMGKVASVSHISTPQPQQPIHIHTNETPSKSEEPTNLYTQTPVKNAKNVLPRKDPIEIIRRDGRVITLPPIEAPATRSSKRKNQMDNQLNIVITETPPVPQTQTPPIYVSPEPIVQNVSKQYINKKIASKKVEPVAPPTPMIEMSAESQESWNSEDDPHRLWCICRQPHNNRFMICCDGCEDWFHGKCVNITKAMGQQMEEQGVEWRCPNCIKNSKQSSKSANKASILQKAVESHVESQQQVAVVKELGSKPCCIVCKKSARASSIYCSDSCILKHAQDSLSAPTATPTAKTDSPANKNVDKVPESRVIVYERKTGRLLAGPNAPTAENLKAWLQKNPTFEVVRPGTLSTIKPNVTKKKSGESNKIQTTLSFAKIPRKSTEQLSPIAKTAPPESKDKSSNVIQTSKEQTKIAKESPKAPLVKQEVATPPQVKTPATPKLQPTTEIDTPKSSNKTASEQRKSRALNRSLSTAEKRTPQTPTASPSTSRRKDSADKKKMDTEEEIRENVRKSLQEHISQRMTESDGFRLSEDEIQQYAFDTESELFELFNHDVGMKYKAKYRSLMFNIKDRKNLSLWEKICERALKPKELVRLSPEELASQELAQWREEESKHQLELIKKSEIDLLAASKTYVLKTHKGEEVMETKESVSTELDPNVPVEDLVTVLNDAVGDGLPPVETDKSSKSKETNKKSSNSRRKDKDKSKSSSSKKDRESKRDSEKRQSRSTRRSQAEDVKEDKPARRGRSEKKSRSRSESKERPKEKSDNERSRQRSRSRVKSKRSSRDQTPPRGRDREEPHFTRSSRHSVSKESSKHSQRSRSKRRSTTDDVKHRSRSQGDVGKSKNDSTDSDSVERPKSAMMKEVHPEYDPHEPMITSAFSEEDLRKSGEDINEISEYGNIDVDSSKSFTMVPDIPLPTPVYFDKQEKTAETESDQEPTSTVESSAATVWNGCINMVDVARFYVAAHEVSGNAIDLEEDLMAELDIVGRINPDTVWDYISKMKRSGNKDIVILRLQAANDEERMQYIALYSYLSSRNRLGVVKVTNTATVKDFYIVPLSANTSLPAVMLPLDGPGLGEVKTHLLIAIIIRQRKKRLASHIPKDIIPAKVARESRKKSYTPPISPRNRQVSSYTSPALSSTVKDKIAASLAAADDDEPYSPGSSNSSSGALASVAPSSTTLKTKMEELNRQIEEQKQQIMKMAQSENEAYSPSKPLSPTQAQSPVNTLADISLPSNLHEILATIKQRSENTTADVDMRTIPMT
ncbi:death-inducer obliterator 1 isoform X1 [Leptidea sinapis]|uniref:death-inducer obliterator 1 isoform X1 n=1 Tax=Leptidea sinapis TaxID=189913 RepID=UPI00212023A5|nr:death-inducer obliterator 1 isoform X1 [Leptidea sinapis]